MIVLWGTAEDETLARITAALVRAGEEAVLLDQRALGEATLDVDADVRATVRCRGATIRLHEAAALYVRPDDPGRLVPAASLASALEVHDLLVSFADITPVLVVNRPEASATNASKLFQLEVVRRLGFAVPETLVTTDPAAARAFRERHHAVVYKSLSGVRSRVATLGAEHDDRLADLRWCPTQLQRQVAGPDVRVHVVGDEVFACEIRSAAADYRYPGVSPVEVQARELEPALADRCRALVSALGLHVAGLDLRRDDGQWYCFEVNPSPAFAFYEDMAGQPIAAAVARLLATATARGTSDADG